MSALSSTSTSFGSAAASARFDAHPNGIDESVKAQALAEEEAAMNQYKVNRFEINFFIQNQILILLCFFFVQTKVASPTSAAAAALNNPFLSSPTNSSANIVDMFGGVPAPQSQSKASDDLLQLGNPFADMFSAPAPAQPPANNNLWMNNGKNHWLEGNRLNSRLLLFFI